MGWSQNVNLKSFGLLDHDDPSSIKVLEFGGSEGRLLYELKKLGYSVFGNDVCAVLDEGKNEYGIEISKLPIEEFVKTEMQFDLIMSWHVVEHLADPRMVMENLAKMLSPGGKMLLHVPVDDGEFDNPDHFHFFSEKSCMKLMSLITTDIESDYLLYNSRVGKLKAATFLGIKSSKLSQIKFHNSLAFLSKNNPI